MNVVEAKQTPSRLQTSLYPVVVWQAMHKLREPTALVRVRQCDLMIAKELLEPARKQYTAVYGSEAPTLTIDQRNFLPPPPSKDLADDADEAVSW
jgi:V-type H+-transporting ATPase subunit E